jgi:hypothetical protein
MRSAAIRLLGTAILLCSLVLLVGEAKPQPSSGTTYLGFDANDYPGDDALPLLRKTFAFTGYWLGPPPGAKTTSWLGKRSALQRQGFGFVVLWNGKLQRNLKSALDAQQKGKGDAEDASKIARQEGFPPGTLIFLDIEEGGRLSPIYHAYVKEWIDELARERFRAGVYCSAMPVNEGSGVTITTTKDLEDQLAGRKLVFWIFNDACPPSPGCTFPQTPAAPADGGYAGASVWQYAQSPRRKEFTSRCAATYANDGNCYAPGDMAHKWFIDANVADSPDPSAPQH